MNETEQVPPPEATMGCSVAAPVGSSVTSPEAPHTPLAEPETQANARTPASADAKPAARTQDADGQASASPAPSSHAVNSCIPLKPQNSSDTSMPQTPRTPVIVSPETASEVLALGDRYTQLGVCSEQPLTETLEMAEAKYETVTTFHTVYSQCNLQFVIPDAPVGGDRLQKLFKEACVIENVAARATAIDTVVSKGAKFLADLSLVQSQLTDHKSLLTAGIVATDEVARTVKEALTEFDSVMTDLNWLTLNK